MKFRKKPVIIEAVKIKKRMEIKTLEGKMTGEVGDWLITGVKGERYFCKPDIFDLTYEPVKMHNKSIIKKGGLNDRPLSPRPEPPKPQRV